MCHLKDGTTFLELKEQSWITCISYFSFLNKSGKASLFLSFLLALDPRFLCFIALSTKHCCFRLLNGSKFTHSPPSPQPQGLHWHLECPGMVPIGARPCTQSSWPDSGPLCWPLPISDLTATTWASPASASAWITWSKSVPPLKVTTLDPISLRRVPSFCALLLLIH